MSLPSLGLGFLLLRSHQCPQVVQLFQVVMSGLLPKLAASIGVVGHLREIRAADDPVQLDKKEGEDSGIQGSLRGRKLVDT